MSGYTGRNKPHTGGGPSGVQRSYASQLKESEPLFNSYEHLQGLPRGDTALQMLRKIASLVKPIMRKRGWRVQVLAEFLPQESNLLGLNINRGYKICIRLRYHNNPDLFLPTEQCVDTMLHELSHIIWGDHDSNFHKLWDDLRDEWETLTRKGYTGEGFLSKGHTLGGSRAPPPNEMRRLARANAEKRQQQAKLSKGSGQRLGGNPLHLQGVDVRQIITDQVMRRNTIDRGCASGRKDSVKLSDQAGSQSFRTKAEEDDANNRAIAQALYELMEEEEDRKLKGTFSEGPHNGGLAWDPQAGLYDPGNERRPSSKGNQPSEDEQMKWAMQESLRSSPDVQTSAFPPPPTSGAIDLTRSNSAPSPVKSEPRETPISAVSRARTFHDSEFSPVSPLVDQSEPSHPLVTDSLPAERKRPPHLASNSRVDYPQKEPFSPDSTASPAVGIDLSEPFDPDANKSAAQWTCEICTCINPMQYLACDACGCERPESVGLRQREQQQQRSRPPRPTASAPPFAHQPQRQQQSLGWLCAWCETFTEHPYWCCTGCGKMKESS